jgi:dUTP pyrophosphatase
MPLKVKILNNLASAPTIGHPGEDLGYDVYALRVANQPIKEDGTPAPWIPPKGGMSARLDLTGKVMHPIRLEQGRPTLIETGIAVHYEGPQSELEERPRKYGLLIRDRSSLASKGIFVTGGVVDAGYRGELKIILNLTEGSYQDLWPGDKIAQIIPVEVFADTVEVVETLEESARKEKGFGSTGK